jgi:poly(3-hydroxybutyrate) depolymerase
VGVLACDGSMSQRIAAFAPVSGAFYITESGKACKPETMELRPCSPGRADVPVLAFHGLADDTIPYEGGPRKGECLPAIPHWVQAWAERDGLGTGNETSAVPGAAEGSSAVRYEFGGAGSQKGLVTHVMDGTVSRAEQSRNWQTARHGGWVLTVHDVVLDRTSATTGRARSPTATTHNQGGAQPPSTPRG